jgi:hypothetical protein
MLDDASKQEMMLWLGTLAKRGDIGSNPDAYAAEVSMVEEALHNGGARSVRNIKALFHHLKAKKGLTHWPTVPQIVEALQFLKSRSLGSKPGEAARGQRDALSYEDRERLAQVLERAHGWLANIPALRQHAIATLDYWGEPHNG